MEITMQCYGVSGEWNYIDDSGRKDNGCSSEMSASKNESMDRVLSCIGVRRLKVLGLLGSCKRARWDGMTVSSPATHGGVIWKFDWSSSAEKLGLSRPARLIWCGRNRLVKRISGGHPSYLSMSSKVTLWSTVNTATSESMKREHSWDKTQKLEHST